jgi:hypothetical protein
MDADAKIVVVGLPFVGKTTFLAALWDVVGSGEIASALQLDKLSGDKHYLNEIRDRWADCQPIERTTIPDETLVSMRLKDTTSGRVSEVVFTDMSGESFQQQWNERVCTIEYKELIEQITGALLFIHPRRVKEAVLIRDAAPLMEALAAASATATASGDQPAEASKRTGSEAVTTSPNPLPSEPHYASTQVQLVELLQFLRHLRGVKSERVRLGVVISAWDVVEKQVVAKNQTPEDWLEKRLPLVNQFLRGNNETFDYEVFGVSAQGGELSDADRLRKSNRPSDRILVLHKGKRSNDITVPVRWVLELESEAAVI